MENVNMKKISFASLSAVMGLLLIFSVAFALFTNGDFESGDFTGWTKSTFLNLGFSQPPGSGGADLSTIVGGPAVAPMSLSDPLTNGNLKYPAYGHYSAKVNSELAYFDGGYPANANTISQTISAVLDPADGKAHVRLTYAAVMVNPLFPHTAEEKPYFRVKVTNVSNGNDVIYDFSSYVGEPGKNWQDGAPFGAAGDVWQYLDWTYLDLASSDAHPVSDGDTIFLEVTAAGCSPTGHPGYVYVDEITDGNIAGPNINATGPTAAVAGGPITYTYTFKNGSGSAVNPHIVINPPADVTFTSLGDAVHCSGLAPVTCDFTGVAANAQGSFTVSGTITLAAAGTTIAHGDYSISATGFPLSGGQTVFTVVSAAGPGLTASGPASVVPGDPYTFTFNYTIAASMTNAQVVFTLPGHTTFVSDSGLFCSETAGLVTCNLGTVSTNGLFTATVLVDKLKKVGTPLTLAAGDYSISATSVPAMDGSTTVTADVLTPFFDVPLGHWALDHIQSIWAYGITGGCWSSPLTYCPDRNITRAEMAVYIERAVHGSAFNPGTPAMTFTDTAPSFAKYFIEALRSDGITGGCGGTAYCPENPISRGEMSVFLLRGRSGSAYIPPAPTGTVWVDVSPSQWAAGWAEELGTSGISAGCGNGYFCLNGLITRAQMAVLVQRTFNLALPTP
jgi:hypothetical protein